MVIRYACNLGSRRTSLGSRKEVSPTQPRLLLISIETQQCWCYFPCLPCQPISHPPIYYHSPLHVRIISSTPPSSSHAHTTISTPLPSSPSHAYTLILTLPLSSPSQPHVFAGGKILLLRRLKVWLRGRKVLLVLGVGLRTGELYL